MISLYNGFYLFPLSRAVNSNSLIFDPSEFKIDLYPLHYHQTSLECPTEWVGKQNSWLRHANAKPRSHFKVDEFCGRGFFCPSHCCLLIHYQVLFEWDSRRSVYWHQAIKVCVTFPNKSAKINWIPRIGWIAWQNRGQTRHNCKWVWSGNTANTNCKQTNVIAMKSHKTITRH